MFKVNYKDTRTILPSVYVVNFEHVIAGWVDFSQKSQTFLNFAIFSHTSNFPPMLNPSL